VSRPRGTVPVKLSRHRAHSLAQWLSTYVPLEKTVLGTAGMSISEIAADRALALRAPTELARILCGSRTGRPRQHVSVYYLPVNLLKVIDSGHAAMHMPRKLRPVIRQLLKKTRSKKGPKLPPAVRKRNLANGVYAPETVRRYRYLESKEMNSLKTARALQSRNDGRVKAADLPKVASPLFALMARIAAGRWLV
jgi:hypothetical protein